MEELYKKDDNHPDNHDGVITHLEPDILECKVKVLEGNLKYYSSDQTNKKSQMKRK